MSHSYLHTQKPMPGYAAAKTKRQKQRAAGLHPDYWYPALWSNELKNGDVKEVVFWKQSIAIYRGADGVVRALEDRCAHRQLKLSMGNVEDCRITCAYHGWSYEGSGKCTGISHSLFGHKMPNVKVRPFPVIEKYGVIFIFPGNAELAKTRSVPEIPEWDEASGWGKISTGFTWGAHHSIIIDNTCDFTHAYLHRNKRPFTYAELKNLKAEGDTVELEYDTKVGDGVMQRMFVNRSKTNVDAMKLGYQYPYQWSSTDDKIKHWCFVLPIDERTSRAFFLFYFSPEMMKVPGLPLAMPKFLVNAVMPIAKRLLVDPLLSEDEVAVEAEQLGYEQHWDQPVPDLNPVLHAFMALTVRKWDEYIESERRGELKPVPSASAEAEVASAG